MKRHVYSFGGNIPAGLRIVIFQSVVHINVLSLSGMAGLFSCKGTASWDAGGSICGWFARIEAGFGLVSYIYTFICNI